MQLNVNCCKLQVQRFFDPKIPPSTPRRISHPTVVPTVRTADLAMVWTRPSRCPPARAGAGRTRDEAMAIGQAWQ